MGTSILPCHLLLVTLLSLQGALANATPYLKPGFHFDYDKPGQDFTIPVTSQCEGIQLEWTRDPKNDTGPSPVAPYFLQVYTSTFNSPFSIAAGFGPKFTWQVPFAPNTLYQICMFDINGVSGGCQPTYTVIPSTTSQPSCDNVTFPSVLSVTGTTPLGLLPRNGYIDQCETLSVTPGNGSPPYILTVAPSGHPPFNITSDTRDPIEWTVSLPVGSQFFLSVESVEGQKWSNGPMRVGGLGSTTCLAPGTILKSKADKIIIGSSVGGTIFGLVVGFLAYFVFLRLRHRKPPSQTYFQRDYFSREDPTRPLKSTTPAPSTIAPSGFIGRTGSPSLSSIPLAMTPSTRLTDLPPLTPPLEPVRRGREPHIQRHRSVEPYSMFPNETGTAHQPLTDIKRPLPPSNVSLFSSEDLAESVSMTSSSANSTPQRTPSTHSRAPTYVPRVTRSPASRTRSRAPTRANAAVAGADFDNGPIQELEIPDLPPQYGTHTADPSLNYAPSILSSGNRF
ncbi:hypothetical protein NLJ89_g10372 [Agrocybe chaxingu]|uniref:Uncharacterized protein n=1 Tax=Agrocybe chaxingu TaxID=84603 RepID=A0A9W8MSP5_9AGAR|nr:hypothetical protein NLJ89_g10372 [Agrocybe chaxingu]